MIKQFERFSGISAKRCRGLLNVLIMLRSQEGRDGFVNLHNCDKPYKICLL